MRVNRLGLRNREIEMRQHGVRRLVILGDSFTIGRAVPEEELFSSLLESKLNEDDRNHYEVINAGVPGYGTAQELLLMKELADDGVIGDAYLLVVFTNDILDNQRLTHSHLRENPVQPGFELNNQGRVVLQYHPQFREFNPPKEGAPTFKILSILRVKLEGYLQSEPALVDFARAIGFDMEIPRVPGILNGWYRPDQLEKGVPLMKGLIREIRDQAHQFNASLSVALVPSAMTVYADTYGPMLKGSFPDNAIVDEFLSDPLRPQIVMKSICRELSVPCIDLYPPLREHRAESIFIPEEGHLSTAGHSIVARTLVRFLAESYNPVGTAMVQFGNPH